METIHNFEHVHIYNIICLLYFRLNTLVRLVLVHQLRCSMLCLTRVLPTSGFPHIVVLRYTQPAVSDFLKAIIYIENLKSHCIIYLYNVLQLKSSFLHMSLSHTQQVRCFKIRHAYLQRHRVLHPVRFWKRQGISERGRGCSE